MLNVANLVETPETIIRGGRLGGANTAREHLWPIVNRQSPIGNGLGLQEHDFLVDLFRDEVTHGRDVSAYGLVHLFLRFFVRASSASAARQSRTDSRVVTLWVVNDVNTNLHDYASLVSAIQPPRPRVNRQQQNLVKNLNVDGTKIPNRHGSGPDRNAIGSVAIDATTSASQTYSISDRISRQVIFWFKFDYFLRPKNPDRFDNLATLDNSINMDHILLPENKLHVITTAFFQSVKKLMKMHPPDRWKRWCIGTYRYGIVLRSYSIADLSLT